MQPPHACRQMPPLRNIVFPALPRQKPPTKSASPHDPLDNLNGLSFSLHAGGRGERRGGRGAGGPGERARRGGEGRGEGGAGERGLRQDSVGKNSAGLCCSSDSCGRFISYKSVAPALYTVVCCAALFTERRLCPSPLSNPGATLSCDPFILGRGPRTHEFHRNSLLNPPNPGSDWTAAQVQSTQTDFHYATRIISGTPL